ncbi:hypothetical protein [Niallia circulans]|uniref:hypothetical protein n=1 Tax=Niallia circulans TaxID=1397 RepID=UPI0026EF9730|nr:hypothetical protein [Niallia circulans]
MDRLYDGKSQAKSGKSQARSSESQVKSGKSQARSSESQVKSGKSQARVRNHKQNAETRNYMPKAASIKANAAMRIIPTK